MISSDCHAIFYGRNCAADVYSYLSNRVTLQVHLVIDLIIPLIECLSIHINTLSEVK